MQRRTYYHSCESACPVREGSLTKRLNHFSDRDSETPHTDCTNGFVEHGLEPLLCEGGTFQILDSSDVLSHRYAL